MQDELVQAIEELGYIEVEGVVQESGVNGDADVGDHGKMDEDIREDASVSEEVEGVSLGGSEVDELMFDKIGHNTPRAELALTTTEDHMLKVVRSLASEQKNGYSLDEGIVLRNRLDDEGNAIQQVCLPVKYKERHA